jgi:hypothetical protein
MSISGTGAKVDLDHDSVRFTLYAHIDHIYPLLFAMVLAVAMAVRLGCGPTEAGVAAAVVGTVLFVVIPRSRRTVIDCDGRVLRWRRWGRRSRTRSLLDLHQVFVDRDGWLVLDPHPGPLQQVRIDARETQRGELDRLVPMLNDAIAQAEHRRGDRPDRDHWRMTQLRSPVR